MMSIYGQLLIYYNTTIVDDCVVFHTNLLSIYRKEELADVKFCLSKIFVNKRIRVKSAVQFYVRLGRPWKGISSKCIVLLQK